MCHYLRETLSPDKTTRRQAEAFLASVESNEGFGPLLLHLIQLVRRARMPCYYNAHVCRLNRLS